jgi:hypothetical protein
MHYLIDKTKVGITCIEDLNTPQLYTYKQDLVANSYIKDSIVLDYTSINGVD